MKRIGVILLFLVACGKSGAAKRDVKLVHFYASSVLPHGARLEVAGILSEKEVVDVPLPKAPVQGDMVNLVFTTPCGDKKVALKLPAPASDDGKMVAATGSQLESFDFIYAFELPKGIEMPPLSNVLFDRSLAGTVQIGSIKGELKNGVAPKGLPGVDERYALGPEGFKVRDLNCVEKVIVNGHEAKLPERPADKAEDKPEDRPHTLFITDRPDQCFVDQMIGFGSAMSGEPTKLQGSRAYWLTKNAPYDVFMATIPEHAEVGRDTSVKYMSTLTECKP